MAAPAGAETAQPVAAQSETARDAAPPAPKDILRHAFSRRYEVNLTSNIELIVRDRGGRERRRLFEAASKLIEDRVHSLGRIVHPHHLRGMAILTIESRERSHDSFVYMPTLGKVRRISTHQRGDSFLGSDVTYEDLERLRPEDFEIESLRLTDVEGETAYEIHARPVRHANYARVVFTVAAADGALLETRYFKRGKPEAYRVVSTERRSVVVQDGYVIPTRLVVSNQLRGTTTEVLFTNLRIAPEISDHIFSVSNLERDHALPILER